MTVQGRGRLALQSVRECGQKRLLSMAMVHRVLKARCAPKEKATVRAIVQGHGLGAMRNATDYGQSVQLGTALVRHALHRRCVALARMNVLATLLVVAPGLCARMRVTERGQN